MTLPKIELQDHFKYGKYKKATILKRGLTFDSLRRAQIYEPFDPGYIDTNINPLRISYKLDIHFKNELLHVNLPPFGISASVYITGGNHYSIVLPAQVHKKLISVGRELLQKLNKLRLETAKLLPYWQQQIKSIFKSPVIFKFLNENKTKLNAYIINIPLKMRNIHINITAFVDDDYTLSHRNFRIDDDILRSATRVPGYVKNTLLVRYKNRSKNARVVTRGALRAVRQMYTENPLKTPAGDFLKFAEYKVNEIRMYIYDFILRTISKKVSEEFF